MEKLQEGKNEYRVSFWHAEGGYAWVKADNPTQAEEKVSAHIDEYGIDGLAYEVTHREYQTVEVE
jgi:hypothetical protein